MREVLVALVVFTAFAAAAAAGPFSQLVIFGDSLSDVGNIAAATGDIYPGRYYYNDRFSNGPVYAESLATGLGLPPVVRSTAGGNNFAYGGAKTSGTGGFEGLFIRDVDEQVDQFLATRTVDPGALFVVFAGANDINGGPVDVNIPVNNLAEDIGRLITAGARNFLVPNLPLLGHTPRHNGNPSSLATYNSRTQQFNGVLATMLDGLEANNPALSLYRFDSAALFSQALGNPSEFGLTNVINAAAPGLQPGASSYNTSQIAPNAHQYMFWDDLHPTATVHAILSERMLALFGTPGDFNHDGIVDAADYAVWRKGVDATAQYEDWVAHFGESSANGSGGATVAGANVPEPASGALMVMAMLYMAFRRGKPNCLARRRTVSSDSDTRTLGPIA
jgi:phospholipase/lecithinase/hemolysin